jgi:hypothetical protein
VKKQLEFIWLERVEEAVAAALDPKAPGIDAPSDRAAATPDLVPG